MMKSYRRITFSVWFCCILLCRRIRMKWQLDCLCTFTFFHQSLNAQNQWFSTGPVPDFTFSQNALCTNHETKDLIWKELIPVTLLFQGHSEKRKFYYTAVNLYVRPHRRRSADWLKVRTHNPPVWNHWLRRWPASAHACSCSDRTPLWCVMMAAVVFTSLRSSTQTTTFRLDTPADGFQAGLGD